MITIIRPGGKLRRSRSATIPPIVTPMNPPSAAAADQPPASRGRRAKTRSA
jgi:hypothetical protein